MNTIKNKFRVLPALVIILSFGLTFFSCQKDEEPEVNEENEAFYSAMKDWYFWTDRIPQINPSAYPSIFHVLEAIRYTELDRWSFIDDWDEFIAYISNSEFIGYGFGSRWDDQNNLRVTFVYNTVDMYEKGVRRSWILEAVNGINLTPSSSLNNLLGPNHPGVTNTFTFRKPDGTIEEMTVEKKVITMNTVLHYEVMDVEGLNIGYLVFQNFTGTSEGELKEVFQYFSENNIDELILDLRYNGGGLTSIARQLSSLIGGQDLAGEPFARYVYNANKSDRNQVVNFSSEANSLGLNRLVTIATRATASASEMVINGLKPYMDVYVVGTNTYGKPMGADILRFNEIWALVPITINITNADDEGNYFNGLPVDVPAPDGLAYDFGDMQEASLQQAVNFILTGSTKGMPVMEPVYKQPIDEMRGMRRWIGAH